VRLRDLSRDLERDPLLKVGAWAMVVALGFAIVVVVGASFDRPMEVAAANAATSEPKPATEPLVRTDPGIKPWVERDIPPPRPKVSPEQQATPSPVPPPAQVDDPRPAPTPKPTPKPTAQPNPQTKLQNATTPSVGNSPPQMPEHTNPTKDASPYHLPPGAIMTLTIPSLGLINAPVLNSDASSALDRGVVHLPDTSLPWSDSPERNVYLAGHRLGWPGTGSHLVFYRLNELTAGDRITLRGSEGRRYNYRVLESFTVWPNENWVTGRVRGRDLLTLQTCTPIPTFQKRLIVRAERV
jgi:sortase A